MSSLVGPRPPVEITISLSFSWLDRMSIICFLSSGRDTMRVVLTPISPKAREIMDELVSTIWPISISSPIVHIEALTVFIGAKVTN